jgi:hypothetical protein
MGMLAASPIMATPEPLAIGAQLEASTTLLVDDKATELAQFLNSREDMGKQLERTLSISLPQSMKQVSDFGIYETEYPGLIAAVVASLKPVMLKAYDDKMPLLWANASQIYREEFSPAELDQLVAFYKSPVGIRFITSMKNNVDTQQMMDAAVKSQGEPSGEVAAAKKKTDAAAINKTNQQMSAAGKLAIFRFENSSLGPKLVTVGPRISKAVLDWDFYFTDEQKKKFLAVRQSAISKFIAKADAAKQTVNVTPSAVAPTNP